MQRVSLLPVSLLPLVGLCLAILCVMTGMGMAVVALPVAYIQASGTVRASGWMAALFAVAYMACQVPVGRWADTRGYRPVLVLGCLLIACSAVIFHLARTPEALFAGRFIQGAGEAPLWASAPALLGRLYPQTRGRVMGLYNAAFHVGLMLGPILGAWWLTPLGLDPFLAFATLSLAAMLLVLVVLHNVGLDPDETPIPTPIKPTQPASRRAFPLVLAGLPLYGAVYGLLVSCFPVHLADVGASTKALGGFFVAAYGGIAAAQLLGGTLSDRYGRTGFMAAGLAIMAAGLAGFAALTTPWATLGAASMGLGLGLFAVASMALVNEACEQHRAGTASGHYFLAWGAGYFAGPLLAGYVGLAPVTWLLAGCALVTGGLLLGLRPRPRQGE